MGAAQELQDIVPKENWLQNEEASRIFFMMLLVSKTD